MKREVKIGIFAVAMIAVLWGGVRFLKGFDILGRNVQYYAVYDRIDGVQSASPVMMRGVKIGSVTDIEFSSQQSNRVVLVLTIGHKYHIPSDSEAKIVSSSLLGGKSVELTYGTATTFLAAGDTLQSSRATDLMDMAGSELDFLNQRISKITTDLGRTLDNVNGLLESNATNINGTLANINAITGTLASEKETLKSALDSLALFARTLGGNSARIDSIVGNIDEMTSQLTEQQFAAKLTQTVANLDSTLVRLNSGDGTLGKLMNDPALYNSLHEATTNLSALLADLKEYPARYVHLSLFGKDPEKMKEKADKRAAKAAEKAQRDSLKRIRSEE